MAFDMNSENKGPGAALVTTDKIAETVALRDAALSAFTKAAETIAQGYAIASDADAYAGRAAQGFMEQDEKTKHDRRARREYDAQKEIASFRHDLDKGVWRGLAVALRLHDLMDKKEREEFETSVASDPAEITAENIRATVERLRGDAGLIFARGLARVFSDLDPRFKSHDAFKIGARIIMDGAFNEYGSWNYHRRHDQGIIDVERVFAVLDGEAPAGRSLIDAINADRRGGYCAQQSETEAGYFRIRSFKNGNAHLWFTRDDLVEKVNKQLAAYYGEVIPDAAEKNESGDHFKTRTTLPAKDLQFYHTPEAVAEKLLDDLHIGEGARILEPSAGEGHLILAMLKKYPEAKITAMEIHPDRFERVRHIAHRAGGRVAPFIGNFLNHEFPQIFSAVIMNPPFYGTHYMDHVRAAYECLKPGGTLRAVLPASARYNETPKHLAFRKWCEKASTGEGQRWLRWRQWRDLPPESFAECGTRIQTTILEIKKAK